MKRILSHVSALRQSEGVDAIVYRSIGTRSLRHLDPFLMLDEFTNEQGTGGFPDHPHRGFETVTYMLKGQIEHEDFEGHRGLIGPGDLQWMTAGKGIVHAEMPVPGHPVQGLQLWVNLPKKAKMMPPKYQELKHTEVPVVSSQGTTVKIIAGESMNVKAAVTTYTPIYYLDVQMKPNSEFVQKIPENYSGFVYILSGKALFGEDQAVGEPRTTLVLSKEGESLKVETKEDEIHFVLIAGEPINEPIVQHGPFVMNSQEEIYATFMDYQMGKNGFEKAAHWRSEIGQRML
jgi:redox-sensitive bicupin YhaK (pirin superfamily)